MQRTLRKFFPLFVLPTLIAFVIVFLIPFLMGIYLSFTEFTTVTDSQWVGLKNYITAFTANKEFVNALWFTVKFAVVSVISINVIGFAMASLLTRGIRGTNLFRTVLFMPNLIGGIVLGWIWQMIFNGILYHYEMTLTFNASFGFWGLVILMNWQMIGYMMIIYIAGIQSIPTELYDAAAVDGANGWQVLTRIKLPLISPTIVTCIILCVASAMKTFELPWTMTSGGPAGASTTMVLKIYNTAFNANRTGYATAHSTILFVLIASISFVLNIIMRRREARLQ